MINKLTNTTYIPGQILLADDMTQISTKINEIIDVINNLSGQLEDVQKQLISYQSNYLQKTGGTIEGDLTITGNTASKYFEQTGK